MNANEKNTIHDQEVDIVTKYKYLATVIDNTLRWDDNCFHLSDGISTYVSYIPYLYICYTLLNDNVIALTGIHKMLLYCIIYICC